MSAQEPPLSRTPTSPEELDVMRLLPAFCWNETIMYYVRGRSTEIPDKYLADRFDVDDSRWRRALIDADETLSLHHPAVGLLDGCRLEDVADKEAPTQKPTSIRITIQGAVGRGKTTLALAIRKLCREAGIEVRGDIDDVHDWIKEAVFASTGCAIASYVEGPIEIVEQTFAPTPKTRRTDPQPKGNDP